MARYHAFFKLQSFALIVASILPFAGNVLYVFHLTPVDGMDWTPVGLTFSSLIIAWILFRYRMLDLVPVARGRLVDTMSDAVLDSPVMMARCNGQYSSPHSLWPLRSRWTRRLS